MATLPLQVLPYVDYQEENSPWNRNQKFTCIKYSIFTAPIPYYIIFQQTNLRVGVLEFGENLLNQMAAKLTSAVTVVGNREGVLVISQGALA